jgi:hypothetical protein
MDTDTIGLALIVGGAAFVCCGVVFMLLVRRRRPTVQENAEEIERGLMQAHRERDDLS